MAQAHPRKIDPTRRPDGSPDDGDRVEIGPTALAFAEWAAAGLTPPDLAPGMTEDDVWAVLHAENIRRGGEWIETRLLTSGPRTNPWFQECGPRVVGDAKFSPSTPISSARAASAPICREPGGSDRAPRGPT